MSIVLTNWQAAFQRERGTWLFTGFAVLMIAQGLIGWPRGSPDLQIIGVSGFWLLWGPVLSVLRMQCATVATPMLLCLPRYRESLRALTFSGAMLAGFAWALAFGLSPIPPTPPVDGMTLARGFLTGFVLYLALTTPRLILSRRTFIWVRRAAILLFLVGGGLVLEAEPPFAVRPVFTPVLVALCAFVWIRLGDMECVKRGQQIALEDAIARGPFPGPPRTTLPWVEKWLQSQMERRNYLHGSRYVWGQLYVTVDRLLPYWKWVLGALLGFALLLGGMGQPAANIVFVASGSLAGMVRWPITSGLVLPGGRKDRYRATISAVAAVSLLLVAAALAVVVLSWLLTPFLGGPSAEGSQATYGALQARSIVLACLLVPWFAALGLLGIRVRPLEVVIVMLVLASALYLFVFMMETWPDWTQRIVAAGVYVASGVFVGGWLFLLLTLWAGCRWWDLLGQEPIRDN